MRIPSASTDRVIYFVAVDATDLKTRETGLSSFTVYRSRDGGTATVMTTPTVTELDDTNMPGVYSLLLDEDTTLDTGHDTEEMCYHITQAAMAPVTRVVEIYRPETTEGSTLDTTAAETMVHGTIDDTAFTPTASEFEADDITEATADHYVRGGRGRAVIFTSGSLRDQAVEITSYALVGGRGHFTTDTLTEAPDDGDTFIIV